MSEIKDLGDAAGAAQPAGGASHPSPAVSAKGAHQAQFTPGPWRVGKAVNGNWIEAGHAAQPVSIARTFYAPVGSTVEDANARLIAAAPALYAAAERAARVMDDKMATVSDFIATVRELRTALAAASSEVSA